MTNFQYFMLLYALCIFLLKAVLHTIATAGGQKVEFTSSGRPVNFVLTVLDWSVIAALISVLF